MAKPIYKTTLQDTTQYGKGSSGTLKLAAAFPNSPLYQANGLGDDVIKDSDLAYLAAAPADSEWATGTSTVSINNFFFSGILDATVKFVDGAPNANGGTIVSPYFPGEVSLEYTDAPNLLGGKAADSSELTTGLDPKLATSPSGPFVPNVRVGQDPAVSAKDLGLSQNSSVTVENMPPSSDGISNPSKTSSLIASSLVTDKNNGELGTSGLPS